jgi:hypothetical protein
MFSNGRSKKTSNDHVLQVFNIIIIYFAFINILESILLTREFAIFVLAKISIWSYVIILIL